MNNNMPCLLVRDWQRKIEAGIDPEAVIPYSMPDWLTDEQMNECFIFAIANLKGIRKKITKENYVRWAEAHGF